ncbi:hypothetical protein DPMN_188626 [Dreissena polymorpha]|uniref:Uncharacterized protein n=1 Tax=Dreissena polymorpha TaxID=45954 RepID=A0A9D4IA38_DREPO|nr:hypothetical protein DPMN_188626 [Dreissena polymorpha]
MGKVKPKALTKQCCSIRTAAFGVLVLSTICMIAYVILHTMEHGPDVSPNSKTLVAQLSMDSKVDAMSVLSELSGFRETNIEDVGKENIVNTVHFVWCEKKKRSILRIISASSACGKVYDPISSSFTRLCYRHTTNTTTGLKIYEQPFQVFLLNNFHQTGTGKRWDVGCFPDWQS